MTVLAAESTPDRMADVLLGEAMQGAGARFGLIRLVDDDGSKPVLRRLGYDLEVARFIDTVARRAATPTTVCMATHDRSIVDTMRRRVIELDRGTIVRDQVRGVYA